MIQTKFIRMMIIGSLLMGGTTPAYADVFVHGYFKRDGTYVAPHYRSAPDGYFYNNWSTKGNINPYAGRKGTLEYSGYSVKNNTQSTKPPASTSEHSTPKRTPNVTNTKEEKEIKHLKQLALNATEKYNNNASPTNYAKIKLWKT